jgi:NADPH:quinone reductase-like Zn-dependent oxidoreductase
MEPTKTNGNSGGNGTSGSAPAMMKAVQFHEYGGADVLRFGDAPRPNPRDDEILVRVRAAGVNPVDAKVRAGAMSSMVKSALPHTAGLDFAGVIEEVGKNVRGFQRGDEVYGRPDMTRDGSYAQYVVVKPSEIAQKPETLEWGPAAALPTAALTAWQVLFSSRGEPTMDLQQGQTVLITGAAGGVGSFAVQLAKWKGARVIATGRAANEAYVKALGADVYIDYDKDRVDDVVHEKIDAVLDVIGRSTQLQALKVLKKGGVLVSTVGIQVEQEARAQGVRTAAIMAVTDPQILAQIAKLVDDGILKVPVSEEMPLENAREAHEHIESGHTRGKIVLDVH